MLKACCECLGASLRNDSDQNTHNGGEVEFQKKPSNQVPRLPRDRNMYLLASKPVSQDILEIKGILNDPFNSLEISLLGVKEDNSPDEKNAIFSLQASGNDAGLLAVHRGSDQHIQLAVIEDNGRKTFEFNLRFGDNDVFMEDGCSGKVYHLTIENIDKIQCLSVQGDVQKVTQINYIFA